MGVTFAAKAKWKDKSFTNRLLVHRADSLNEAAKFVREEVKDLITQTQGSYFPPYHSDPGDPPFMITKDLAKSYKSVTDRTNLVAYIGSNLPYARYLEQGTSIMEPRPYLLRTLIVSASGIEEIMCRKWR